MLPRRGLDGEGPSGQDRTVPTWTCPDCGRPLGRRNQSHECAPGLTLAEYLERQPPEWHPTYRAVIALLLEIGDLIIEPVDVGILVKRRGTFAELRPRKRAVELSFKLTRSLDHPRIRRVVKSSVHRRAHFVWLTSPEDVDDEVRQWIVEAWLDSPV